MGNNPVNFNDPTGNKPCDEEFGCGPYAPQNPAPVPPSTTPSNNNGEPDDDNGGVCDDSDLLCANDLSPELIQDFWDANNIILGQYNKWTTRFGVGGLLSMAAGYIIYSKTNGAPIFTPEFISLLTGISVLDPTLVGEALIVAGIVSEGIAFVANQAANNLQDINNAIVKSGAYDNGGTITANLTEVTIVTPNNNTPPVSSFLVGWAVLYSWTNNNPNLVPTQ